MRNPANRIKFSRETFLSDWQKVRLPGRAIKISSIQDTSVAGRQTRFAAVRWWRLSRLLSLLWRVRLLNLLRRRPVGLLRLGRRPVGLRRRRRRPVSLLRQRRRPIGLLRRRRRPVGLLRLGRRPVGLLRRILWFRRHSGTRPLK